MARVDNRSGRAIDEAALILGALCLAAAILAQGGRLSGALDLLGQFAPFWLAGATLALARGLLTTASRRRALIVALGVLGIVSSAALMATELVRPIPRVVPVPGAKTLELIQFNTWDETLDAPATAAWIASQRPDLVFIEEAEAPIRAALVARGFNVIAGVGHVAIFSRAAPLEIQAPLSAAEWHAMPPFARATFGVGADRYTVIAAHLPEPTRRSAVAETRMFATLIGRYDPRRLIVAGDFNLTPWSFALRRLDHWRDLRRLDRAVFSWPARLSIDGLRVGAVPILPIDHVYAGSGWSLVSLRRGPAVGSDHHPLVVVLTEHE
jgi:endonuclease/exonuclease/phosphatase (EEP) superfamily protein YafD